MTAILQMIYCFLLDMIASFKDIWLLGWDSILGPVDALLASVGTGGLDGAGDRRSVRLAARSDRHVASDRHYRGGDGGAVPVAVGALCAVGLMIEMLEGVPGSGKSYYAVSERLLKWVRAGRRVYVYVDGLLSGSARVV